MGGPIPLSRYLPAVLPLLLCLGAKPTLATPLTVGIGSGVTSQYSYHTNVFLSGTYEETFGTSLITSLSLDRKVGDRVSLHTNVDHFRSDGTDEISIDMASVSVGVRRDFGTAGPYLECLPAIYIGRWSDTALVYDLTSVKPGFQLGAGVKGPLLGLMGFEMGADFRYSADWPSVRQHFDPSDFKGLRQLAAGVKLTFGL